MCATVAPAELGSWQNFLSPCSSELWVPSREAGSRRLVGRSGLWGKQGCSGNHRSEARVQVSNGVGVSVLLRWVPGNSACWGPHQSWGPDEDWSWG